MSSRTILTLAVYKANWEQNTHDHLETFVPFVANLIIKKSYDVISVKKLKGDFLDEYGLDVPAQPLKAILSRMRTNGLIGDSIKGLVPLQKIAETSFSTVSADQERKYNKLIDGFVSFAAAEFGVTLTVDEAEIAILAFLQKYDRHILFANRDVRSSIPHVKTSDEKLFLIHTFAAHIHERDPELFGFLFDLSIAHILANTLLFTPFDRYEGILKDKNYYLDTAIILSLLVDTDTDEAHIATSEFVAVLKNEGVNLSLFQHTYHEITSNLTGALRYIDSPRYDPSKAGRTAQTKLAVAEKVIKNHTMRLGCSFLEYS